MIVLFAALAGAGEVPDLSRAVFEAGGCAECHVPNVGAVTGLYSDLLVHDVGVHLRDSSPDAELAASRLPGTTAGRSR